MYKQMPLMHNAVSVAIANLHERLYQFKKLNANLLIFITILLSL